MSNHANEFIYQGMELELFKHSVNWKQYYGNILKPFLCNKVLEVGAGIGVNAKVLTDMTPACVEWIALEPELKMCQMIQKQIADGELPDICKVFHGTTESLPSEAFFDTILYIDVLEHIEDDQRELDVAYQHLNPGGHLIVISPAHEQLFSEFDKSIGHLRRYTKQTLAKVAPKSMDLRRMHYLDSCGAILSLGNALLLKKSMPTLNQIQIWDKLVIPCSRIMDHFLKSFFGRSVMGVWRKV